MIRRDKAVGLLVSGAVFLFSAHCGDSGVKNVATGATCPTTSTLTYENFGRQFMDTYCVSCHAGKERPDLSTLANVQREAKEIAATAAGGPLGENTNMPGPGEDPEPTSEERKKLGEWIAGGAK